MAWYLQSAKNWTDRNEWFLQSPEIRELDNINGKLVVFEWKISQSTTR